MTQQFIGFKVVTAWPQDKDGAPGYAVRYEDGYTSWSPKNAFDTAYVPLDPEYYVSVKTSAQYCISWPNTSE